MGHDRDGSLRRLSLDCSLPTPTLLGASQAGVHCLESTHGRDCTDWTGLISGGKTAPTPTLLGASQAGVHCLESTHGRDCTDWTGLISGGKTALHRFCQPA